MYRSRVLLLVLALCLLTSYTTSAQSPTYVPSYEQEEEESSYAPPEEEEESSYAPPEEEEESSYAPPEEEEESSYAPPEEEEEEYEAGYYSYVPPSYEEEYEEYEEESYNYNSGSYSGTPVTGYGGNSSSYSSSQSYSGSYDASTPSDIPKFPPSLLTGFVVDIHFLAVDIRFQYIAYHYCNDLFPGYSQCAIYNGTGPNSRLVATEQIVSGEILATLPIAERKLYHSHAWAIKNGLLILPGVPADQELKALQGAMDTYGKVTDYWHSYQNFPLGPPRLAYGLAEASQINTTIVEEMERSLNLNTTYQQRTRQRASLTDVKIVEGVNDYLTSGKYPQYVIQEFDVPSNSSG